MQLSNQYQQINEERLRELAREAEKIRLARQAQANSPESNGLIDGLMHQLSQLGQRLQAEYQIPTRLPKKASR